MPYIDVHLHDQQTIDLLTWAGYGAYFNLSNTFGYITFAAYTITLFGLLNFKYWSKPTFVGLTLLSIIITGIQGIEVLPPIDAVLSYLTSLADGAIITLMYLTSISSKFNENA